jgi:hypothetical protein
MLGDRRRQRGLTVVNVPNGTHVHVGLLSLKFFLRHFILPGMRAIDKTKE